MYAKCMWAGVTYIFHLRRVQFDKIKENIQYEFTTFMLRKRNYSSRVYVFKCIVEDTCLLIPPGIKSGTTTLQRYTHS